MTEVNNMLAEFAPAENILTTISNDYLPYITVTQALSGTVDEGIATSGDLVLESAGVATVLAKKGVPLNIVFCYAHPKAVRLSDMATSFDVNSSLYKELAAIGGKFGSGVMIGPEYLVYLPDQQKFAVWHFNSKTLARLVSTAETFKGKSAIVKTKLIESKGYKWYGPELSESVTPHTPFAREELEAANKKFTNDGSNGAKVPETPERAR